MFCLDNCMQSFKIDLEFKLFEVDLLDAFNVNDLFATLFTRWNVLKDSQALFFSVDNGNLGIICRCKEWYDTSFVCNFVDRLG